MDNSQVTQVLGYTAVILCGMISLVVANSYRKWRYYPLIIISVGMLVLGCAILLDLLTSSLPSEVSPSDVAAYVRGNSALSFAAIGLAVLGFLLAYQNTRGFLGRLLLYFFIYGFGAGGYFFVPNLTVLWQVGSGWQYDYGGNDLALINQLIFLPIYELLVLGLLRLRKPFRTLKSRRALITFLAGLCLIVFSGTMSYIWGDLIFYGGLAVGFGLMCIAFVVDPLVYTITNVKIYDLVVCTDSGCIARHKFEEKSGILSEDLFSGAFSGINTLTRETLLSKTNLRFLQTDDKAVLIAKTSQVTVYLVTNQMNRFCLVAMNIIGRQVEKHYQRENMGWHVAMDPSLFARETLRIFTFA